MPNNFIIRKHYYIKQLHDNSYMKQCKIFHNRCGYKINRYGSIVSQFKIRSICLQKYKVPYLRKIRAFATANVIGYLQKFHFVISDIQWIVTVDKLIEKAPQDCFQLPVLYLYEIILTEVPIQHSSRCSMGLQTFLTVLLKY